MNLEPGKTYVRRLSAVSHERDALALRMRLERALAGADFNPPGLPASAILCVRRLSDRRARPTRVSAGSGALAFTEWQRSVAAAIERLARNAASPARGPVPANAEAVIFGDRAELLACLAADWCEEAAPARWWWRSLFGGLDAAAAMLSAWLDAPEHVPAALGRLNDAGNLIRFARALGETDARSIRRRVVEKFGLYEVAAALDSTVGYGERETLTASSRSVVSGNTSEDARAEAEAPRPSGAPWRRYVPELRAYGLGREQGCLVGVGLMLLRAPSRVRASQFSESLKRWRFDADATTSEEHASAQTPPAVKANARRVIETATTPALFNVGREASARPESADVADDLDEGEAHSLTTPRHEAKPRARVEHEGDAVDDSTVPTVFVAEDVQPVEADERGLSTVEAEAEAEAFLRQPRREEGATESESSSWEMNVADSVETDEFVLASPVGQARIQTEFGGLFYLVNLGLFLNLYGDFTTPLAPGLALPLWDFLALLGERLCGPRVREDAVWGLLTKLTGRREDEPPGRDFEPDDVWRLPASWLTPFRAPCVWSWSDECGRLRVRHAEGFLVLDVPLARAGRRRPTVKDVERQLENELIIYDGRARFTLRRAPSVTDDDAAPEDDALGRWLGRLVPYVETRLRRALGVSESHEAARLVCEHAARVSVTETRLDVTFELERLPVEVRLSGLDRDPGWVPAAGRYVAFDYE